MRICSDDDFGMKELIDTMERDAKRLIQFDNPYNETFARLCLGTVAGYKAKHPELWEEEHAITWHKIDWDNKDTLPSKSGLYLCRSILGTQGGKYKEEYSTFFFSCSEFICEDFIITHWAENFNKPEDV